jgi:hypothetical protein
MRLLAARIALAAFAATAAAAPLSAQLSTLSARPGDPGPRFGILAGLNSATLSGESLLEEEGGVASASKRRNGILGGVYLVLPVGAGGLSFRPELLYAQKGAGYEVSFSEFGESAQASAEINLTYLEVPLLLQYALPVAARVRPQLYAGPAVAVRTGCTIGFRASGGGESFRGSAPCDDIGEQLDEDSPGFKRLDVGAVVGGALGFDAAGLALAVGARYTHGFSRIAADDAAPRNRAFSVYGSVEFPRARRPR